MTLEEWRKQYFMIKKTFGYSEELDQESAIILDSIIRKPVSLRKIEKIIKGKTVFVIGSGPSLPSNMDVLKKFREIPKIVADGAAVAMAENHIIPEIVVTDLDGDEKTLKQLGKKKTIFVVHAHGDNIGRLPFSENFKNCLGTTQVMPFGKVKNFGGFTDGDRCVFLAKYFGAKNIILVGMDFGKKIGRYSQTKDSERRLKLKKLRIGKRLLEWLASKNQIGLFTTGDAISGFKTIKKEQIKDIIIT